MLRLACVGSSMLFTTVAWVDLERYVSTIEHPDEDVIRVRLAYFAPIMIRLTSSFMNWFF